MSRTFGPIRADGSAAERPETSPPALRTQRSRWRDPLLWVGVILVATSALVGGRVLRSAHQTVSVWTAGHDLSAGAEVRPEDFKVTRVHFDESAQSDRYLLATSSLPRTARAAYDVGEGELVARSALDQAPAVSPQLPLGVASADVPLSLAPGDHVSVWALPPDGEERGRVTVVLSDVSVLEVSGGSGEASAGRQVLLQLESIDDADAALRLLAGQRAVLVRVGT